jgi:outer membrane immunogenic protein
MRTEGFVSKRLCSAFALAALLGFAPVNAQADGGGYWAGAPSTRVNWSGIYLGVHAGYGWSNVDSEITGSAGTLALLDFVGAPTGAKLDPEGFLAGGHIGIQHQWGRLVAGVEASLTPGGQLRDSSSADFDNVGCVFIFCFGGFGTSSFQTEVKDFMSIAGRLGYAQDNWLLYGKAGYASARIETSAQTDGTACFFACFIDFAGSVSTSKRHDGYVLGAGLEYMIRPNVILGVEYDYTDLRARTHTGTAGVDLFGGAVAFTTPVSMRVDPDAIHAVYGRLSFKLGREEEARPLK